MLPIGYGAFPQYPPAAPVPSYHLPYPNPAASRISPWLSDWLPSLDLGERGQFGDRFGSLVSGFAALFLVQVSHLRDYNADDFQQISFFSPQGSVFHISPATAARLVAYVHADLPLLDSTPPSNVLHSNAGSSRHV